MGSSVHKASLRTLVDFAHELADLSGPAILPYFRKPLSVENKANGAAFDPVTKADRAAERVIAKALKTQFPDHALVGEEYGTRAGAGRYRWVVDPIDGTRAFIMGSPLWGTVIGLYDGDAPVLGIVDQPFTAERFWSDGKASYMRVGAGKAKRIKTRACPGLDGAILTSTHPDLFEAGAEQAVLARLKAAVRMTRYGGDCYGYCLLAAGHVDVIVEAGLKTYDVAGIIPIIEHAGGIITTWDGKPAVNGGNIVAAGDKRVHEAVLKLIAKR